ncbi:aminoimidazole riboside kinase [Ectobacillus ponti]|uniref:Aminoimidazole riboside kinase n=1 Tax=Ectobacillus ponti TaxID=2961894 RepID=A0AA41X987_9BACI|nr:aminoimidazole riboside kinase [Ectobacillus ponti]MCP8969498.1 aminoimidazole riboside kinase [Ectobacillus ponti]
MKKGIVCLGEALIDFIPADHTNMVYQKCPGGAPANVAVGAARLGIPSTFLGKLGNDVLGTFLKETLAGYGVRTDHLPLTDEARTGIVFVTLAESGERSFEFFIERSADQLLAQEDISEELLEQSKILHFGSISLIHEPSRSATMRAVELAKKHGVLVSYDPNLRLGLWESGEAARQGILSMMPHADLLKISEEELEFLTGHAEIEAGLAALAQYNIPYIFITLGAEGSYVAAGGELSRAAAMKVTAVDTTGAGDAYVSGILYSFHEFAGDKITVHELEQFARFASVSGGLAASQKGAMTALPTLEQVQALLQE